MGKKLTKSQWKRMRESHVAMLDQIQEEFEFTAYIPSVYFEMGSDGLFGDPVSDGGVIVVYSASLESALIETSFDELMNDALDGYETDDNGVLEEQHHRKFQRILDALQREVKKLEAALGKQPKNNLEPLGLATVDNVADPISQLHAS